MSKGSTKTHKRINITLPEATLGVIDQLVEKGGRSRFVDRAIRFYIEKVGRSNLKQQLKEGAQARAERDLGMVRDWFEVENEAWQIRDGE